MRTKATEIGAASLVGTNITITFAYNAVNSRNAHIETKSQSDAVAAKIGTWTQM